LRRQLKLLITDCVKLPNTYLHYQENQPEIPFVFFRTLIIHIIERRTTNKNNEGGVNIYYKPIAGGPAAQLTEIGESLGIENVRQYFGM